MASQMISFALLRIRVEKLQKYLPLSLNAILVMEARYSSKFLTPIQNNGNLSMKIIFKKDVDSFNYWLYPFTWVKTLFLLLLLLLLLFRATTFSRENLQTYMKGGPCDKEHLCQKVMTLTLNSRSQNHLKVKK